MKLLKHLLLGLFFLLTCCSSNDYLKEHWWKYGGGYHLGDVLVFDDRNLSNDTIFNILDSTNRIPEAIIIKVNNRFLANDYQLEIKSLETSEIGFYYDKGFK